jgi:hypothetical protein
MARRTGSRGSITERSLPLTLGDSVTQSKSMRFSVHTVGHPRPGMAVDFEDVHDAFPDCFVPECFLDSLIELVSPCRRAELRLHASIGRCRPLIETATSSLGSKLYGANEYSAIHPTDQRFQQELSITRRRITASLGARLMWVGPQRARGRG